MRLRSRVPAFRRGSVLLLLAALFGVVAVISSAAGAAGSFEGVPSQAERQPTPGPTGVHVVRELAELRTATSDTFLQSDGSRAVKIYTHPVNYRASGGAWEPIESKLARASDGTWHPIASPVPLSLPASLGSGAVELSIWLTEQGVIYSDEGVTKPGGKSDNGVKIMKAYVETPEPLTRQSPHITMFDYYEMRGEAKSTGNQDSGLLNPVGKPRPIFYVYRQRTNPPK